MNLTGAIAFWRGVVVAEEQARKRALLEADERAYIKVVRGYDAMFEAPLASGISRPFGLAASEYKKPARAKEADKVETRTIYAVATYAKNVTRAWLGGTFRGGKRGDFMAESWFAAERDGELKIVSIYTVCAVCHGGATCKSCTGGWDFSRGQKLLAKLGKPTATKKLAPPDDELPQPAYDLIPT